MFRQCCVVFSVDFLCVLLGYTWVFHIFLWMIISVTIFKIPGVMYSLLVSRNIVDCWIFYSDLADLIYELKDPPPFGSFLESVLTITSSAKWGGFIPSFPSYMPSFSSYLIVYAVITLSKSGENRNPCLVFLYSSLRTHSVFNH